MFDVVFSSYHIITLQLLFESTKCKELSDTDGNIFPSFHSRILKAFLDVFRMISWDLWAPAIGRPIENQCLY